MTTPGRRSLQERPTRSAIKANGTLWAWGLNTSGQMGDATNIDKNTPTQVGTDNKWVTVAAGNLHTVAVKSDGTLWAWGVKRHYQLGDGTNVNKNTPTQVGTATDWSEVFTAYDHTIAVKKNGTLYAWGSNGFYRLGDGTTTTSTTPKRINATITVTKTGYGSGTITSAPSGMTCNGNICTGTYEYGAAVEITATAVDGKSSFGSWSGCTSEADNVCTVQVTQSAAAITVSFSDIEAPTGTVSMGYDYTDGITKYTRSATPVLTLAAADPDHAVGGVTQMMFSNNGSNWSAPETYAPTKTNWNITDALYGGSSSEGLHTVYVKFNDQSDNWTSPAATATIYYSTGLPTGSITINAAAAYTLSSAVTVTLGYTPPLSGMACTQMALSNDNMSWTALSGCPSSANWTLTPGDGDKYVYARYTDSTGNVSSPSLVDTITLDGTAPSGSVGIEATADYVNSMAVTLDLTCSDGNGSGCSNAQFSSDGLHWSASRSIVTSPTTTGYSFTSGKGQLWGWGVSDYGQTGNGSTGTFTTAAQSGSGAEWFSLATSGNQSAGIRADGTLWMWGNNNTAQLGTGSTDSIVHPDPVQLVVNASAESDDFETGNLSKLPWTTSGNGTWATTTQTMHAGFYSAQAPQSINDSESGTLELSRDSLEGTISFWFSVSSEQNFDWLRFSIDGVQQGAWSGSVGWTQVSFPVTAGTHRFSWTYSKDGSVSTGMDTVWIDDVVISAGTLKWAAVAPGRNHTAALTTDGSLWSWGYNAFGEMGVNSNTPTYSGPQQEYTKSKWTAVAAGDLHTAAIRLDGTLWAWGYNYYGQLGDGTQTDRMLPVQEASRDTKWVSVAADRYNTIALKSDGTIWGWGLNNYGQLGDNSNTTRFSPVQEYSQSTQWRAIASGTGHVLALKADGTIWAWGNGDSGQVGASSAPWSQPTPVQVGTNTNWASITAGSAFSAATRTDGTAWVWGSNANGQQGNGTTDSSVHWSPVKVGTDNHWASLAAGENTLLGKKVPDGGITAYVRYRDTIGNWSGTLNSKQVVLDATAPNGTITINNLATYATATAVTLAAHLPRRQRYNRSCVGLQPDAI